MPTDKIVTEIMLSNAEHAHLLGVSQMQGKTMSSIISDCLLSMTTEEFKEAYNAMKASDSLRTQTKEPLSHKAWVYGDEDRKQEFRQMAELMTGGNLSELFRCVVYAV